MLQEFSSADARALPPEGGKSPARTKPRGITPRTVLVVDDERLLRWSIGKGLTHHGHRVLEADTAAKALHIASNEPEIDLILLDYRLQDRRDLSLLLALIELTPHAIVFMMTAYAEPGMRERALQLGARSVFDKPFQINQLVASIEAS